MPSYKVTFPVVLGELLWLDEGSPYKVIGLNITKDGQFMMLDRCGDIKIRDCALLGSAVKRERLSGTIEEATHGTT